MKILALSFLMTLLTMLVYAQDKPANKFNFGIRGAFNESYISNVSNYPQIFLDASPKTSRRNSAMNPGFTAGIFLELPMGSHFTFRPELNYSRKGAYNYESRYRD